MNKASKLLDVTKQDEKLTAQDKKVAKSFAQSSLDKIDQIFKIYNFIDMFSDRF